MHKIWLNGNRRFYKYAGGEYIREKLAEKPKRVRGYRLVQVPGKPGRKVLVALLPGGGTKAVALLRHKSVLRKGIRRLLRKRRSRRG